MSDKAVKSEDPFSEIQRGCLAALEEAGEDDLAALANMLTAKTGDSTDIDSVATALESLLDMGLIDLARTRDETSRRWLPLSASEGHLLLKNLKSLLRWSKSDRMWKRDADPRAQVLLTDSGQRTALSILAKAGFH